MPHFLRVLAKPLLASFACMAPCAFAASFGVFDARTQALAGTGVALGDLATGMYYNPALLALHAGDEDATDDGRHTLPALTAQYSDAMELAYKAVRDDLEGALSDAISAFNEAPGATTAADGEAAAMELQEAMLGVQGEQLYADLYLGYAVSEPGHKEGGAFFVGTRALGGGFAVVEHEDLDLVEDYVEAMRFIRTNGNEGVAHPELFAADGSLADPEEDIVSSARGRVALVTEIGVSAARLTKRWGEVFSLGFSPKVVNYQLYDDQWVVVDGRFRSTTGNQKNYWVINTDLGMIWAPSERFLVGLATKDLIPYGRSSEFGYEFKFRPRTRLGLAYRFSQVQVGWDLDLYANREFIEGEKTQQTSLAVEYQPWSMLQLRAGYSYDIDGADGLLSGGFGWRFSAFSVDVAVAESDRGTSFGLQLGIAH